MLARLTGTALIAASVGGFYAFTTLDTAAPLTAPSQELMDSQAREDERLRDSVLAEFDVVSKRRERALNQYPNLTRSERRTLRNVPYHRHVSASEHVGENAEGGLRLEPVARESKYYVLQKGRGLLAPAAIEALDLIGERFHALLAEEGLPPARFIVTSAFRSPADQASLRRVNRNAARGTSSHEFGGSFDITYRRFAAAQAQAAPQSYAIGEGLAPRLVGDLSARLAQREVDWSKAAVVHHARAYQAALGRVLVELQEEGRTYTLRERRQPCYHVTARPAGA